MFKIFRMIRQNLIDKGLMKKYLLYATGEIVLVVIGILIALQINNWNEDRKTAKAVLSALGEIREDLVQDSLELHQNILQRKRELQAQERIIQVLQTNQALTDEVLSDFGKVMLQRQTTLLDNGYSILQEIGLGYLKDKSLRNNLVAYYERFCPKIQAEINDDKFEFENTWLPYVRQHFSDWEFGGKAVPNDIRQIQNDPYLLTTLKININNLKNTLIAHQAAIEAGRQLIMDIDQSVKL